MADATQPQDTALSIVKKAYNASRNADIVDLDRFARYYSLYRGRQINKNYNGLANLFIPEPHRVIARKTAKIVNAIKKVKVTPTGSEDKDASKTGSVMMNFLSGKLSIKNFYRSWIKESRILGMSWAKVTWDVSREKDGEQWRAIRIEQFSVDRIFLPPSATILDIFEGNLEYLIAEYESLFVELESNKNYDKTVLAILKSKAGNKLPQNVLSQQREINRYGDAALKEPNQNKRHYIQEYWGKKDGKDWIIVVADNNYVLRDEANPYVDILENPIPFAPMPASIEPMEQDPIGDIEPNESLFNEVNDNRNQRMDTVTLNIDPAKIILRSAGINKKDLITKRGWTIESNIPNGIQFVPPSLQGVVASINEEKIIRGDIQQSTNVLDFAPQSDMQAGINIDTARGTVIAKGESDIMTADEIDIMKESLKMFWRIVLSYSQAFLDQSFVMRVVEGGSEQFITGDKAAIAGNLDVDIEIETLQDETTRQTVALTLFNQAKTVPGAKIGKFFTDLLENFKENVNIKEYYEEPAPLPPEPPKISISLRADMSELQAAQVYKQIPGVDPAFADPLVTEQGRELMRGNLPETKKAETDKLIAETKKANADADKALSETAINLAPDPVASVSATSAA